MKLFHLLHGVVRFSATVSFSILLLWGLPLQAGSVAHAWSSQDLDANFYPGRRPAKLWSGDYAELLWTDTRSILSAPMRWDRQDWMKAGALTAVLAGSAAFDGQIRNEAQEDRTHALDSFTQNAQKLGSQYSWLVLGGFEAVGWWRHDDKLKAVAMDGLTASIISAGIITPIIKIAVGRVRPNTAASTTQFKSFSGNYSFPSGHVTQAFAVASVIAAHYDSWWVQGTAYGLAGLVGYSRIQQNAHFTSDVVAGAIIGTVVGRAIVHRHDQTTGTEITLAPYTTGRNTGLIFSRNF